MLRLLTELLHLGYQLTCRSSSLFVTGMENFGYVLLCRDPDYALRLAPRVARQIGLRLR
jgi:hypothetical protein